MWILALFLSLSCILVFSISNPWTKNKYIQHYSSLDRVEMIHSLFIVYIVQGTWGEGM
jgi:hypothetical protein